MDRGILSRLARSVTIASAVVAVAACADAPDAPSLRVDSEDGDPVPFAGSAPSLEALGGRVLDALSRSDSSALEHLRLTEHEHNVVVWPELPASAPEVRFPVDYAWENIENRNRKGLNRIVPLYADQLLGVQGVECRGPTETFRTFRVRTDCWVLFVRGVSPEVWEAQIFKDVLERGGGHKIFRYYDEEPRPHAGSARAES